MYPPSCTDVRVCLMEDVRVCLMEDVRVCLMEMVPAPLAARNQVTTDEKKDGGSGVLALQGLHRKAFVVESPRTTETVQRQ